MRSRRDAMAGAAALSAMGAAAAVAAARPATEAIRSDEYWAEKGPVRLYVYRKRLDAPRAEGEAPRPVLFLVHGSSLSSRSTFDLAVPGGRGEYSLMDVFARWGWDVWTMDHEGYGRSSRTDGNSDTASGAADLRAAAAEREAGARRFHLLRTSSGALRAALFAQENPDRAGRLALAAFTWTGRGSPTLERRARNLDSYRANNRRPRGRDMIRSIFTRDKPGTSDMAVAEALADAELQFGEDIPTGTYVDMTANLPVVDPSRIASPVLLIRGEHDGIASMADLWGFFGRLPNGDKQFAVLPHAAHSLTFGHNRAQFWHAAQAFVSMPATVAA